MTHPLSPKQLEFIINARAKWNLAHGSVRSGKTVCTLFAFMDSLIACPDSQIWMIGKTSETIYDNAVRLLLERSGGDKPDPLSAFRNHCTWRAAKRELLYLDKVISTVGAKDEGSIGLIQGKTFSRVYCDEMTLYPESIIDMIDTRLSNPYSMGFASMNPSYPTHKLKQWIDLADAGNPNYYAEHFVLDDNPYLDESYKDRVKSSSTGLFYKRNILGQWCMAEGAIFDFFDKKLHVLRHPPCAAEYWIAGIDYGTRNPFACVIMGVSSGRATQTGKRMWVEKEYYWDQKKMGRQKTNSEYAEDLVHFLEPYAVRHVYIDPSAAAMKEELRRKKIHTVDANNDVEYGIQKMTSEMKAGNLFVMAECTNLIEEIEQYVWDSKSGERGWDEPVKQKDHACVTGETKIMFGNGLQCDIAQVASCVWDEWEGRLCNFNVDSGSLEKDRFNNPCLTRKNAEIFELELEDGKILRATGDHQVLTERGYIELQQLTLSDTVLTCNIKNTLEKSSI